MSSLVLIQAQGYSVTSHTHHAGPRKLNLLLFPCIHEKWNRNYQLVEYGGWWKENTVTDINLCHKVHNVGRSQGPGVVTWLMLWTVAGWAVQPDGQNQPELSETSPLTVAVQTWCALSGYHTPAEIKPISMASLMCRPGTGWLSPLQRRKAT